MIDAILRSNLIWTEGITMVVVLAITVLVSLIVYRPFLYVSACAFVATLYFFRNPERQCRAAYYDKRIMVSPADGKIVGIARDDTYVALGCTRRVSIFLSLLDVHVMWIPIASCVERIIYKPGEFCLAYLPKSSELNERNDVVLVYEEGKRVVVRQIAGAFIRRICCWVRKGDIVSTGSKYGMIRFGSRVDLFVPDDVVLAVGIGQHVYGGETVIGRWSYETSYI